MQTERAIPEGYMTVGELAKKMGTTVRTLQYYDREGLLVPSAQSEGGRRLYTYKDMIRLHQIQSLKSLGFSLDDIKNRLISLDTPQEVARALESQAQAIREKIVSLQETAEAVEALRTEVMQMGEVDFKKYADIIVNLQMHNEYYWLIKHFDEDMLDHVRSRFDRESGLQFMERFNRIGDEALALREEGAAPDDPRTLTLAGRFWELVEEFTGGDMSMLPKLMELGSLENSPADSLTETESDWARRQNIINEYLQPALGLYFQRIGLDPFAESV